MEEWIASIRASLGTIERFMPELRKEMRLVVQQIVPVRFLSPYPAEWDRRRLLDIVGHRATVDAIERGDTLDSIVASWEADERAFEARRGAYALYGW